MLPLLRITVALPVLLLMFICNQPAFAQEDDTKASSPMRLSYAEGDVSFWRLGAPDWVAAQLNTPLAVGDALYVGQDGDLELQMGSRAFVRADDETQFSLVNQTADFVQFKVTSGRVSFDLRALPTGYSVEVDTPNAVFTIDRVGYYRVDVDGDVRFVTRRGGRAIVVPAGGQAMSIHPSEEIVVQNNKSAQAETYVAPELDQWDRWNYDRTEHMVDTVSERYLPYGVAGASDLDHYGNWRVVQDYGLVWVPEAVPAGWAPYSTGRWSWDPYYQWTWIDDAPWGWAPFHYGRWVNLTGYWAWAPGPVVRQPVYAPALVAFFNVGSHVSVGLGSGGVGWVSLSWGEPVNPWWGQPGFIGRPSWRGWGGPRVVNNVVIRNTTVVNVTNITYHNTHVNNAVSATTHEHFGNGHVHDAPMHFTRPEELEHVQGVLPIKPKPSSLVGGALAAVRPPDSMLSRPVVSSRPPHESKLPWRSERPRAETTAAPEQHYVPSPRRSSSELPRPEFGNQTEAERARPSLPPRFEERRRHTERPVIDSSIEQRAAPDRTEPIRAPRITSPESPQRVLHDAAPPRAIQERARNREARPDIRPETRREVAVPADQSAELPGNPANRLYREKDREKNREKNREKKERRHQQQNLEK